MKANGLELIFCLAMAAGAVSCVQEQTEPEQDGGLVEFVFTGYADEDAEALESKTTLHADGVSVHWGADDRIMVFSGAVNGVESEKADVKSDPKMADFTVKTTLADTYHAIYPPYDKAQYSADYDYITVNLPTVQTAVDGSFADGVNLAMAKSEGSNLFFRNVGALLAVKNPTDNAGSIKIVSRDGSVKMSGEASVSYNDGEPEAVSSVGAVNYVEFASGLLNTKGQTFNAVVYPGNYASGFDVIFKSVYSPYLAAIYSSTKSLELKRNDNYMLFSLPDGVFGWNSIAEPTGVSASDGGWQTGIVTWTWNYDIPSGESDPRAGYRIHVRKSGATEVLKTIDVEDVSATSYSVTGLDVDNHYDFGVQTLKKDEGKPSEIVWTENVWINGKRCIPPTPVSIEQISETQVTVTWKNNTGAAKQVMFWKKEAGGVNTAVLAADATSYTTSVVAGRTYEFGIQAKVNEKTGEDEVPASEYDSEAIYFDPYTALTWKDLLYVDMGEDECLKPEQVSVALNGQQATISWECYSSAATGFNVFIRESTGEWSKDFCAAKEKDARSHTFYKQLEYGKTYVLGVQSVNSASISRNSEIVSVEVIAVEPSTSKYDWESSRTVVPVWSDMTLCYGGNPDRSPYLWDKERWASHALYTDGDGQLHYLFDAFLALEFAMGSYTLNYDDSGNPSARKQEWSQLMNYWFDGTYGFQALDDCIAEAAAKIGAPDTKRYVIFVLPDPIYCSTYTNKSSSTTYWGKYEDGTTADFSTADGRVKAYKWMIDQVRARFAAKDYKYIELAGFYILQETLSASWNYGYKEWKTMLPEVASYCHGYNEGLYWIPYGYSVSGTGYDSGHDTAIQNWKSYYGFDLAILQPNKYWDYSGNRSWTTTCNYINYYNMGMEIEFEGTHGEDLATSSSILTYRKDGTVNSEAYNNRVRLREYFDAAKNNNIYRQKPLVLYSGTDGMHELASSDAEKDVIIYRELCDFILEGKH